MYNARYHIASLTAVFLALALGLVLGGLVVQGGSVGQQQTALVEGLRKEFATLRSENDALATENGQLGEFAEASVASQTAGRLQGHMIVVLVNAGRDDGLSAVRTAVESAGGATAEVTMLEPGLGLDDPGVRATLGLPLEGDVMESVTASLAAEWTSPGVERPLTAALVEAGSIRVDGITEGTAAQGIVDIASPEGASDKTALAIADAMAELGVPAVGAQGAADTGKAAAASDLGMSGVSGLGSAISRYSLVALLSGATPGNYGVAPGADALFPAMAN